MNRSCIPKALDHARIGESQWEHGGDDYSMSFLLQRKFFHTARDIHVKWSCGKHLFHNFSDTVEVVIHIEWLTLIHDMWISTCQSCGGNIDPESGHTLSVLLCGRHSDCIGSAISTRIYYSQLFCFKLLKIQISNFKFISLRWAKLFRGLNFAGSLDPLQNFETSTNTFEKICPRVERQKARCDQADNHQHHNGF